MTPRATISAVVWLQPNGSSIEARRVVVDGAPGFSFRRLTVKKLALILLLVASPLFAEVPTLKLPAEVKGEPGTFIAIRAESDAAWVNFRADAGLAVFPSGLLADRKATVLTAAKPGRYRLFAYTGNEDGGADAEVLIVVGNAPPVVVPPGPVIPPDVPPVVVPPVVQGPRKVLIIRESTRDTPEFARLLIAIRNGEPANYLASHKHRLYTLDDNDKDMNGQPTPLVEKWRPHYADMTLPVVFILDDKGALVHKQELPPTADNPATILDILKAHGG